MRLAMFDLDNTLLHGDSDHAWGEFLVEKQLVDPATYQAANDTFYAQYKEGTLDIYEFLSFTLKPLSQHSLDILQKLHAEFMQTKILPIVLPKAIDLVESHRVQGDHLMIITATNRFVTGPIAAHFKVDTLIATEPEIMNGHYTGNLAGIPCYRSGKIDNLNAWFNQNPTFSLKDSFFYSDSHNDIPLLSLVDHPIVVDADDVLSSHAQAHNWKAISLR